MPIISASFPIILLILRRFFDSQSKIALHKLVKYRRLFLGIILILSLVFLWGVFQLRIDFSFDSFYPRDNESYQYYTEYQKAFFESQNYLIYVAIQNPEGDVFDAGFMREVDSMLRNLSGIEGVDSVLLPTEVPMIRRRGVNYRQQPYLQFDSQEAALKSRDRVLSDSTLIGTFITRDFQYLCGYLQIDPDIFDSQQRDLTSRAVRESLSQATLPHFISGIPYIRTRYVETIGSELAVFVSLAILFITTVLFLVYRTLWGILIPLTAVLLSLVWIVGFMGVSGENVNLVNNLIIPLTFVVGTSDVIHLTTKYLSEARNDLSRRMAMERTLREIGFAIFLTSLTTAIGFGSLLISKIPPIRSFGIYAAIGVMITYCITIIVLPNALMRLSHTRFGNPQAIDNLKIWERLLNWFDRFTKTRPRWVLGTLVVIIGLCGWLIPQVPTDTHLIEDIGSTSTIRESMEFFETQSFGLRPFELGIHLRQDSLEVTDRAVLAELDKIQHYLKTQANFGPFLSPASLVKEANFIYYNARPAYRRIPDDQQKIDDYVNLLRSRGGDEIIRQVVSEDGRMTRISSRLPDIGTNAFEEIYAGLEEFYQTECDTSLFYYVPTGHAYLTETNLVYVRQSLLGGLGIAFVVVGIIMGLLFRSWRMLFISMVPNVIPLILTGGIMGIFGITLTASTSLVFVIAFGVAVDDTIHFLTRYRLERRKGADQDEAIRITLHGTGKAMIITSLVLMAGFVMLLASNFGGTFNTGLFTGLTIVFALVSDLFLLPVLLRWIDR